MLRLTANDGELNGFDDLTVTVNPSEPNNAIDFGGTNAYVTFGEAPGLGVSTMTIEAWFRRDGAGATADTGSGGIMGVPIVTKGRAQNETPTNNMNYSSASRSRLGDVLAADFEDNSTGLNHPVAGVTPIPADGAWHHAAATYDGTDLAPVPRWRARGDVGGRSLHATVRQHSACRHRVGTEYERDGRRLLQRRHR